MAPRKKTEHEQVQKKHSPARIAGMIVGVFALAAVVYWVGFSNFLAVEYHQVAQAADPPAKPVLNVKDYNTRMLALAHINIASTTLGAFQNVLMNIGTTTASTSPQLLQATTTASTSVSIAGKLWPKAAALPLPGALLPFNRIVAYYGNFYSTGMGVLGEYPPQQMLAMLASTTAQWQAADPSTHVIPAIDYIAVTAQASPGADGMYRARMPASQIDEAISLANQVNGIVILDVQVGLSNVQTEIPLLAPYLKLPNVELAIDPEFSMKDGAKPGTEIGTMDATDVNFSAQYLASLVTEYNLPPKILIVHRFTDDMLTNVQNIKPLPQVQVVIDMDGFGSQAKKIGTYTNVVAPEPVQFTGFKLFYKNDNKPPWTIMSPAQVLSLTPSPIFIQYQ